MDEFPDHGFGKRPDQQTDDSGSVIGDAMRAGCRVLPASLHELSP